MIINKMPDNAELSDYTNNLIQGKKRECLDQLTHYKDQNPDFIDMYEKIIKKSLYEVGILWEQNKITVATEHLSSSITESLLNQFYRDLIPTDQNSDKKAVLTCIENEQHRIGLQMVSQLFEKHNWETYNLGSDTPSHELISYLKNVNPDILAISISIYFNMNILEKTVMNVREIFPNLRIIIGGQAFNHGGSEHFGNMKNISFISDLYELEKLIINYSKRHSYER